MAANTIPVRSWTELVLRGAVMLCGAQAQVQAQAQAQDSTAAAASAAAQQAWPEVGRQGVVRLVLVPLAQARDREAYARQIAQLCALEGRCFINFYTNATGAVLSTPLPDAVFQEATAVFRRSEKHAAEQFRWSCRLGLDPGNCF